MDMAKTTAPHETSTIQPVVMSTHTYPKLKEFLRLDPTKVTRPLALSSPTVNVVKMRIWIQRGCDIGCDTECRISPCSRSPLSTQSEHRFRILMKCRFMNTLAIIDTRVPSSACAHSTASLILLSILLNLVVKRLY